MRRLFLVVVLCLIVAGCKAGTLEHNRYEGSEGVTIAFLESSPPDKIYELRPFPVSVEVHNQGAQGVSYEDIVVTFSYDPLYIEGGLVSFDLGDQDRDGEGINGRSLSWPQGEKRVYDVPTAAAFFARNVYGRRESPTTDLVASACYRYNTVVGADVCIDTDLYENDRDQVCEEEDVSLGRGQGAPIAVTRIEVDSFPVIDPLIGRETVKPHFTIYIEDVGSGRVIGHDGLEMESACLLKQIPREELNTVRLKAQLLGTELECLPGELIPLYDGKGEARCTVPSNELTDPVYSRTQNFQTTLLLNISYLYKDTTSKELQIFRVPGAVSYDPNVLPPFGEVSGYMYDDGGNPVLDDAGQVYTECRYYAENPESTPAPLDGKITEDWGCGCSFEECIRLGTDRCVGGYCPAGLQCCDKQRPGPVTPPPPPQQVPPGPGPGPSPQGTAFSVQATAYYIPDCKDFSRWSTTGRALTSIEACRVSNKGFYEDVRCQGTGFCDGKYYRFNTIAPTKSASGTGTAKTKCATPPVAKRTLAVNNDPGTSCYVPFGSKVYLDFGSGNPFTGEYIAEDTGSAINGCRVDVFAGSGKDALREAETAVSLRTATLTILEEGNWDCTVT